MKKMDDLQINPIPSERVPVWLIAEFRNETVEMSSLNTELGEAGGCAHQ